MLYNPKWTKTKTETDPLSLDSLIAWLEEQDGRRSYRFMDTQNCILAQYFKTKGFRLFGCGGWSFDYYKPRRFWFAKLERQEFSKEFALVAAESPSTFGAARARSQRGRAAV